MLKLKQAFLKRVKNMNDFELEEESRRLDYTHDPLPTSKDTQLWVVVVSNERRLRRNRNSLSNSKVVSITKKSKIFGPQATV